MTDLPARDWIKTALNITGHFEDSEDPFGGVTGDFDGMGISLGVLQWNIGSGSLQPLVKPLGEATVARLMPAHGQALWKACNAPIADGLRIVRGWQTGTRLGPEVRAELKSFCHSPDFIDQQIAAAETVAARAFAAAKAYAAHDPATGGVGKPLFCWFFDVHTQNGGLSGLGYADVKQFIDANGASRADDTICDWLSDRNQADAGYRDSHRNAALWRDNVDPSQLSLFVLSFLRSQKSRTQYRADVLNRKGTIALGTGWVHLELHDLTPLLRP